MPRLATLALATTLVLFGQSLAAQAACYADYRARRDAPYALSYGVIELPASACSPAAAPAEIARRIARDGWTLLDVRSIFGPEGLNERKDRAGTHFLRY